MRTEDCVGQVIEVKEMYKVRVTRLRELGARFELSVSPIGYFGIMPTKRVSSDEELTLRLKALGLDASKIIGVFMDIVESDMPIHLRVDITDEMARNSGWSPDLYR